MILIRPNIVLRFIFPAILLAICGAGLAVAQVPDNGVANAELAKALEDGEFSPHAMAVAGDEKKLRTLIAAGADVNAADANGYTPLHYACIEGHLDCVKALLENGAKTDIKDENGYTPLDRAAELGQTKIVNEFIQRDTGLDVRDSRGRTLLMAAIESDMQKIVADLLKQGVDVNAVDARGDTALHKAVYEKQRETISALLKAGADVNAANVLNATPLHCAILRQDIPSVEVLLAAGADVNARNRNGLSALHLAAVNGYVAIEKMLLDKGANIAAIDNSDSSVLACALYSGDENTVKLLLDRGAGIFTGDSRSWQETLRGISACDKNIRAILPQMDFVALAKMRDSSETTMLHVAAGMGESDFVKKLVENGARIDAINHDDITPLMCGLTAGDKDTVKFLLDKGAKIFVGNSTLCRQTFEAILSSGKNITALVPAESLARLIEVWNEADTTPLHLAAEKGVARIAEQLLADGLDVNAINASGATPLICALRSGDQDTVKIILDKNPVIFPEANRSRLQILRAILEWEGELPDSMPDINVGELTQMRDESGATLVHTAAQGGATKLIKLLLSVGADVNAVDNVGMTPLHYAMVKTRTMAAATLLEFGADIHVKNADDLTPIELAAASEMNLDDLRTSLVDLGSSAVIVGDTDAARMAYRASLRLESSESMPGIAAKFFVRTFSRGDETTWEFCSNWMSEQNFSSQERARVQLAFAGICLDWRDLDEAVEILAPLVEQETDLQMRAQAQLLRALCFVALNENAQATNDLKAVAANPECGPWGKVAEHCMEQDVGYMLQNRDVFATLKNLEAFDPLETPPN